MVNFKRLGATALSAVLTLSAVPVMANGITNTLYTFDGGYQENAQPLLNFGSFSGIVTEIGLDGSVRVQNAEGGTVVFTMGINTFLFGDVVVGAEVTGFYNASGFMTLQYPPHHEAAVIAQTPHSILVDRFEFQENGYFVSAGGELALNFGEDTPIHFADGINVRDALYGRTLEEVLDGRKLVVTYAATNRMIPAGTIPSDPALSVTVLFETAVHLPGFGIDLEIGAGNTELAVPSYQYATGVVTYIAKTEGEITRIRLRVEEDIYVDFNKDHLTHVMGADIAIGDTVKGFYNAMLPTPMIWPPQYTARVLINENTQEESALFNFVGRFELLDEMSFISESGNGLILNIGDDTPLYYADGTSVRDNLYGRTLQEVLDGRTLVVSYTLSNRAMIAGTMPSDRALSVVVLFERAVTLPGINLDLTGGSIWAYNYGISVNGRMLDALWHYQDGGFFVPFRAVVNMLGFGNTINWDDETREITVFNGTHEIRLSIGADTFTVGETEVVLSNPAILVNDTTYVPFKFFQVVFGMNNAWMSGGQIFIDNEEVMDVLSSSP